MYCAKCGNTLPDDSLICGYCGALVGLEEENPQMIPENKMEYTPSIEEPIDVINASDMEQEEPTYRYQTVDQEMIDINAIQEPPLEEQTQQPIEKTETTWEPSEPPQREEYKREPRRTAGMDKRARPMRTAGFFGTQLLLLIPVINIILLFVWAFRKRSNFNRKAYARSILIWILIGLLLLLAGLITMIVLKLPTDINYWIDQLKLAVNRIPYL